jgi:hypothetical protein
MRAQFFAKAPKALSEVSAGAFEIALGPEEIRDTVPGHGARCGENEQSQKPFPLP